MGASLSCHCISALSARRITNGSSTAAQCARKLCKHRRYEASTRRPVLDGICARPTMRRPRCAETLWLQRCAIGWWTLLCTSASHSTTGAGFATPAFVLSNAGKHYKCEPLTDVVGTDDKFYMRGHRTHVCPMASTPRGMPSSRAVERAPCRRALTAFGRMFCGRELIEDDLGNEHSRQGSMSDAKRERQPGELADLRATFLCKWTFEKPMHIHSPHTRAHTKRHSPRKMQRASRGILFSMHDG